MRKYLTKFSHIFECGAVFRRDSKGAKMCKSCRSRQELSDEYVLFSCKKLLRYSRERASQSLPKQKSSKKMLEKAKVFPHALGGGGRPRARAGPDVRPELPRWGAMPVPALQHAGQRAGEGPSPARAILQNWQTILQNFAVFWRARSRLYQNEILQENMRLTAFFKLYKMCTLLRRCDLNFLNKNSVWKISNFHENSAKFCKSCCKICKISPKSKNVS